MHYDKIKTPLGRFFNRSIGLRKLFYWLLDLLLLRAWHVHSYLSHWRLVQGTSARILDAGSGFGQYSYYLAKKSKDYQILALDVKEDQVADCNQFFSKAGLTNVTFEVGDLVALDRENEFDLVLCVDVMEHIEEDVQVMTNYFRALKPGGMLLISTPSDQGGSDVNEDDDSSFIEEHVRDGYGLREIQKKLKTAGFILTEVHYQYGAPGKISWKLSMKWPCLCFRKASCSSSSFRSITC